MVQDDFLVSCLSCCYFVKGLVCHLSFPCKFFLQLFPFFLLSYSFSYSWFNLTMWNISKIIILLHRLAIRVAFCFSTTSSPPFHSSLSWLLCSLTHDGLQAAPRCSLSKQRCPKCGHQTSSLSSQRRIVRNVNSQT